MEQRAVGRSGLKVSRLALGTMTWGRETDEHEAADQLKVFLDAGGTLIDATAGHGDPESEHVLDMMLNTVFDREDVVLAMKAGMSRLTGERVVDTSRKGLLDALDATLLHLRTDRIDLLQVQSWSDAVPLEETLGALDAAVAAGKARYIGISNYSGWQTARAVTIQEQWPGRTPIVSTQMEYHLLNRSIEREVLPCAAALGLGVLPYSPLAGGVLTGKYRHATPRDSRAASPYWARSIERHLNERSRHIVEAVATAASGLDCSPAEVALAWVRDVPGVTAPVVGARTAAQLRVALGAEALTLPAEIRAALDDVSGPQAG